MEVKNNLRAIINCSICLEMYTDPKMLSCVHTFCAKCLKAIATKGKKKSGDRLECPVCRSNFLIPHEGFTELQKNFFMEKLVTLTKILKMKAEPCDACTVEEESSLDIKASPATSYCCSCSLKLCRDCSVHHKRSRLTISHKLVVIDDHPITAEQMEMLVLDQCEKHTDQELKVYCTDCRIIICALCYIESHQNHIWEDIKIAASDYREKLLENLSAVSACEDDGQQKKRRLAECHRDIEDRIRAVRNEVEKRRAELIRLVNKQAALLLEDIDLLRKTKLNEIEKMTEEINQHKTCLESFNSYVTEFAEKATATDTCRAVISIDRRARELEATNKKIEQQHLPVFNVSFCKSDLQKFSNSKENNILGNIHDKNKSANETTESEPAREIKDLGLLIEIEQLKRQTIIEKLNSEQHQKEITTLNLELIRERTAKNKCLIKEKQLNDTAKKLEQEIALLNQKIIATQTELEDRRNEFETLNSEIEKCRRNERGFAKERNTFTDKEKQLSKRVQQLASKVGELNKAINQFKQEAVSERTAGKSLKAENRQLHEQQDILQKELCLLKKEILTTASLRESERNEKSTLEKQLINVTLQLEQEEEQRLFILRDLTEDKKTIQELEKKLTERNSALTAEGLKLNKCQTELNELRWTDFRRTQDLEEAFAQRMSERRQVLESHQRRHQPQIWRTMEMTIRGLGRILPFLLQEHEVNETLIQMLSSLEMEVVAGAIEGIAFLLVLPAVTIGLILLFIIVIIFNKH